MRKILILITAITLIGVLAACNQTEEGNKEVKESVTPVKIAEAKKGDLVLEKSLYGRTAPKSTTPVMAAQPGEITNLEVENGEKVEEDDLIATIQTARGAQNIYASTGGEITQLTATEGSMASNQEPLAVIADFESMKVNFTVTEDTIDLFEKEDTFPLTVDGKEYEAEITSISTMPDKTGLYPVEATVENSDDQLLAGMVAEMAVPEQRVTDSIIVPTEAVIEESSETFVYVVKDGKAAKKLVTIKETQSDKTAIEGKLNAGDQVVTEGQLTLSDGGKVSIAKEGNKS
ncbi:efflux RND transporter periplasmic adaptor subunit [Virgibacillus kekensis]|uniref:Efflux RND transporter periplasmic adaptor subunit n=1 Tax=Virgibacillus kekensis TaxID=202261 RepID=A0ABV9DGT7_9BACI